MNGERLSRPGEYEPDTLEFMYAVERYKRENGIRLAGWGEVVQVLHSLGYRSDRLPAHRETDCFAEALERYSRAARRPFPKWSEVFGVALAMGYQK
jgi:hypothetical protein